MRYGLISLKNTALIYFLGGIFILLLNLLLYNEFKEINYITLYAAGSCFVVAFISLRLRKRKKEEGKGPRYRSPEDKMNEMDRMRNNVRNLYKISMILGIILILASIVLLILTLSLGLLGFLVLQTGLILFILGLVIRFRIN